jgi:hypothetical protein
VDWREKGGEAAGEIEKYEDGQVRIYDVPVELACPAKKAVNGLVAAWRAVDPRAQRCGTWGTSAGRTLWRGAS